MGRSPSSLITTTAKSRPFKCGKCGRLSRKRAD
jgi:hypothetical protein